MKFVLSVALASLLALTSIPNVKAQFGGNPCYASCRQQARTNGWTHDQYLACVARCDRR